MRRPVKPFVTEYKGPSRRPAFPTASPARRAFEDPGVSGHAGDMMSRGDMMHAGEDSYDAAMRAADALFAPSLAKHLPDPVTRSEAPDGAPFLASPAPGHEFSRLDSKLESAPRGGRILRVLDEPEVPVPAAALEDEHVPKRRGRKPGSKNKPKLAAAPVTRVPLEWTPAFPSDAVAPRDPVPAARVRPSVPQPLRQSVQTAAPKSPVFKTQSPKSQDLNSQTGGDPASAAVSDYAARNSTRFSWVRTKLAPGEQWKRRLPKVCW